VKKFKLQFSLRAILTTVALVSAGMGLWRLGYQRTVFRSRASHHRTQAVAIQGQIDKIEGQIWSEFRLRATFWQFGPRGARVIEAGLAREASRMNTAGSRFGSRPNPLEPNDVRMGLVREYELAWLDSLLNYHKGLQAKYDLLAGRPWLPVDPDPPMPVRSVRQEEDERITEDAEIMWRKYLIATRRK
jgi:hypothetical protein